MSAEQYAQSYITNTRDTHTHTLQVQQDRLLLFSIMTYDLTMKINYL